MKKKAPQKAKSTRVRRGAARKPNIILFGVDSLLSTHMSCYGYDRLTTPHIDQFARDATLFERTFSSQIPTTPAYTTMFTGLDAFSHGCVALRHKGPLRDGTITLAEMLEKEGYETLCVGFSNFAASRGFQKYIDFEGWGSWNEGRSPKAGNLNAAFLPELDRLAKGDKPFFVLLRYMDPHSPYLPPEPFERMFYHGDPCDPSNKSMEPVMNFKPFCDYFASWMPPGITDKDYLVAQYDGALAYMDTCIQQVFNALKSHGIYDDSIIILNGDHGETLHDHECWFDHHGIYDVTLKVPLIIRYPGRLPSGARIPGYNQHKDLVPTLLELAGIRAPRKFDGRSLMQLVRGETPSFESSFYISECTWMRKHGWRTPEWKLIVALEPDFHFKPEIELYNLIADPGENSNVAAKYPEIVAALRTQMEAHISAREKATGNTNPMTNQPHWHGNGEIEYFTSSQQAYDTMHIGDPKQAAKLQADAKKKKK